MQNHIYLKEVLTPGARVSEAYTTLTGALKSEGLFHIYLPIRYVMVRKGTIQIDNVTITKIVLNHQKHSK